MWILKFMETNQDVCIYLPCLQEMKVGRIQTHHVSILDDKSVSREHASLFIIHEDQYMDNVTKIPEVVLRDLNSKYGTYVNEGIQRGQRVSPQNPHILKNGDKIRFGMLQSKFSINYEFLIATSSQLNDVHSRNSLRENLVHVGGHLTKDWVNQCSYLVMTDLRLTVKTVCALAAGAYIVTPSYFEDLAAAVGSKSPLPIKSSYLPTLKEQSLNSKDVSFDPDETRGKLFQGKTFFFLTKTAWKRMRLPVCLAGGTVLELCEENYERILEENSVLIKARENEETLPSFHMKVLSSLRDAGLVPVPEHEIGLAVLYKSTEKFCNPKLKINAIFKPEPQLSQTQSLLVYAMETQDEMQVFKLPEPHLLSSSTTLSRAKILESGEKSEGGALGNQLTTPKTSSLSSNKVISAVYSESETQCSTQADTNIVERPVRTLASLPFEPYTLPSLAVVGSTLPFDPDSSESIDVTLLEDKVVVKRELPDKVGVLENKRLKVLKSTLEMEDDLALVNRKAQRIREDFSENPEDRRPRKRPKVEGEVLAPRQEISSGAPHFIKKEEDETKAKSEPSSNDFSSELCEKLNKALIVVEITSLVKPSKGHVKKFSSCDDSLPNYKNFKKVAPYSDSRDKVPVTKGLRLPKIIGGEDLMENSEANNRREEFLQTFVNREEDVEVREETGTDEVDEAFTLKALRPNRKLHVC